MKTEKGRQALVDGGFEVHETLRPNRWYVVTAPDGENGAVLRQHDHAWHYFAKDVAATASDSTPGRCHYNELGDVIDTDDALRSYRRLLYEDNVPQELRKYHGVYAAMQQVCHE